MAVQVIKARKPAAQAKAQAAVTKQKVAAYCRVSTDTEEQEGSYEAQCQHYTSYIRGNPNWLFAGIYADQGISGTQMKHREDFLRMMADCEAGKINLILTKSISRFSRNTVDCLQSVRKLKELGIAVYFEKENINTLDGKGEVLITIMASIAQQESASISQNIRMGWHYSFQQGRGALNYTRFMGLTKGTERGSYEIDPETAPIVRRIFREFLDGHNPAVIAAGLERDGIPSPTGNANWQPTTIRGMLQNEKYCGDLLCQKYYVKDFLTHKNVKNEGALPQYYVEGHHAPIIPKQVFFLTQGEIMRREKAKDLPVGKARTFTEKLICPVCGKPLNRYAKPARGILDWRCGTRDGDAKTTLRDGKSSCGCRYVPEVEAKKALLDAINQLPEHRDELIRKQGALESGEMKRIDALLGRSKLQEEELEKRRQAVEDESDEAAFLDEQIAALHGERDQLIMERAVYAREQHHVRLLLELVDALTGNSQRVKDETPECSDPEDFFRRTQRRWDFTIMNGKAVRFTDDMVTRFVKDITVTETGLEVHFQAGITVTSSKDQAA